MRLGVGGGGRIVRGGASVGRGGLRGGVGVGPFSVSGGSRGRRGGGNDELWGYLALLGLAALAVAAVLFALAFAVFYLAGVVSVLTVAVAAWFGRRYPGPGLHRLVGAVGVLCLAGFLTAAVLMHRNHYFLFQSCGATCDRVEAERRSDAAFRFQMWSTGIAAVISTVVVWTLRWWSGRPAKEPSVATPMDVPAARGAGPSSFGVRAPQTIGGLRAALKQKLDPVDRHRLYNDLEQMLYRLRSVEGNLATFDAVCEAHHQEMPSIIGPLIEQNGRLPVVPMYEQQCVRQDKAHNWEAGLVWAERGVELYSQDPTCSSLAKRLRSRAAKFRARVT